MNELPGIEEAIKDLANIRRELEHMRNIRDSAMYLSSCLDVGDYKTILLQTDCDIGNGMRLEQHILKLYPTLT